MDCRIQPEDKQELLDLTELLKEIGMSELQKLKILWYVRGQFDSKMMNETLQPTGT